MILDVDRDSPNRRQLNEQVASPAKRPDGVPSIENSSLRRAQYSTSKLLNDEDEDDRLSNLTEIILSNDKWKFQRLYNLQGNYSANQSVRAVFSMVIKKLNCYSVVHRDAQENL